MAHTHTWINLLPFDHLQMRSCNNHAHGFTWQQSHLDSDPRSTFPINKPRQRNPRDCIAVRRHNMCKLDNKATTEPIGILLQRTVLPCSFGKSQSFRRVADADDLLGGCCLALGRLDRLLLLPRRGRLSIVPQSMSRARRL